MGTILPEGESIRRAVKWIAGQMKEHPSTNIYKFVNEATSRFDLSPKDATFLQNFYSKEKQE